MTTEPSGTDRVAASPFRAGDDGVLRDHRGCENRWALVLAGGDGVRLRELTRQITGKSVPKQYCRIIEDRSLLESTLMRTSAFAPASRTLVIVNRDHLPMARDQLAGVPPGNIIVQPENRDTGPGLLLSLLELARRDQTAMVAVFPSDHYVRDEVSFIHHVRRAASVASRLPHLIALLGILPDRPEARYGYIRPGTPLNLVGSAPASYVAGFAEKPSAARAASLIADGALWNSFVMVFQVSRMLELLGRILPDAVARLPANAADPAALTTEYRRLPPWNFSRDFLSQVPEHLVVVRAEGIGWCDLGTPEAVASTLALLRRAMPRGRAPGMLASPSNGVSGSDDARDWVTSPVSVCTWNSREANR
ncbi:MAG: hypothetical protein DMD33_03300 [Gemmatimonadetes bacterium]|nr:MAG: hypothetical protein DMD33_03300 [Gemmatimonadota bacterium]